MGEDLKWLVGLIIGAVGLIGGIVTRDRQMSKQIRESEDCLHGRINRVKDEYVRKDDLANQIQRVEAGMKEMRDEMRLNASETTKRLDSLIELQSKR